MSWLLFYACGGWTLVLALFLSLVSLGLRDIVRGLASTNWRKVARGMCLLAAAVATIVVSYVLWVRWVGLPWP
jgi:hypothetical protein